MIQARILEQTVWIIPFVKQCFCFIAWQISRYEKCLPCGTMILSVKTGM